MPKVKIKYERSFNTLLGFNSNPSVLEEEIRDVISRLDTIVNDEINNSHTIICHSKYSDIIECLNLPYKVIYQDLVDSDMFFIVPDNDIRPIEIVNESNKLDKNTIR